MVSSAVFDIMHVRDKILATLDSIVKAFANLDPKALAVAIAVGVSSKRRVKTHTLVSN
jgi:hypothetical protein